MPTQTESVDPSSRSSGGGGGGGGPPAAEATPTTAACPRRRGVWTPADDRRLKDVVSSIGAGNWNEVSRLVPGRTMKSCRLRWTNQLRPTINKGPYSQWEEAVIVVVQAAQGNRWADMARMLEGRTDNSVKNQWNCAIRPRLKALWKTNRYLVANPQVTLGELMEQKDDASQAPTPTGSIQRKASHNRTESGEETPACSGGGSRGQPSSQQQTSQQSASEAPAVTSVPSARPCNAAEEMVTAPGATTKSQGGAGLDEPGNEALATRRDSNDGNGFYANCTTAFGSFSQIIGSSFSSLFTAWDPDRDGKNVQPQSDSTVQMSQQAADYQQAHEKMSQRARIYHYQQQQQPLQPANHFEMGFGKIPWDYYNPSTGMGMSAQQAQHNHDASALHWTNK